MYIIIVGAGDIGTPLIQIATSGGNDVAVIERNSAKANQIANNFDCLVIQDDATVKDTIRDAGAETADAIISTTDQDATNIMVCLLAQELEIPTIVSVVHNPEHMGIFEQIGVNTMENPQSLIAEYLYRAVKRPSIVDYMRVGAEAEVFEILVGEDAPISGMTLQEAADSNLVREEILIVAIERNGQGNPITPRGNTEIQTGDVLTVYSSVGATPEITDIFGRYEDHGKEFDPDE
ncbi:MAG: TrkA family potassium uptake protein [Halorientalis sp.]